MFFLSLLFFILPLACSDEPHYTPDYAVYHTLAAVETTLLALSQNIRLKRFLSLENYKERTYLNNTLYKLTFTDSFSKIKKRKILLSCGEHARELIVVESCLDLIHNLTSSILQNHQPTKLLFRNFQIEIFPLLNPDGKQILEQTQNYCTRNNGRGVDLNRNFDHNYGGNGSSSDINNEEYRGSHAFSEVETRFVRDSADEYECIVSLHSGEQQIFTSFVDSTSKALKLRPTNAETQLELINRIQARTQWFHRSGIRWEFNDYVADGTMFDWFTSVKKTPFSLCVELYGGPIYKDCFVQFNPHSNQLKKTLVKMREFYFLLFEQLVMGESSAESKVAKGHSTMKEQFEEKLNRIENLLDDAQWRIETMAAT